MKYLEKLTFLEVRQWRHWIFWFPVKHQRIYHQDLYQFFIKYILNNLKGDSLSIYALSSGMFFGRQIYNKHINISIIWNEHYRCFLLKHMIYVTGLIWRTDKFGAKSKLDSIKNEEALEKLYEHFRHESNLFSYQPDQACLSFIYSAFEFSSLLNYQIIKWKHFKLHISHFPSIFQGMLVLSRWMTIKNLICSIYSMPPAFLVVIETLEIDICIYR